MMGHQERRENEMTYIVTMSDNAKTEIEVRANPSDVENYGLVQAIIEAARANATYMRLKSEEDATIRSIWIEGDEITQF